MFRTFSLCVAAAVAVLLNPSLRGAPAAGPRLQMVNGDYYSGSLLDSDEPGSILWQSDVAVEPFRFALPLVAAAHFPRDGEAPRPQGDFCIELVGGDALFGSLLKMTADDLEVDTKRFGKLRIERVHVQRLQPWGETSGIEYMGPDGLHGWTTLEANSQWREEAGHPLTDKPGSLSQNGLAIPPQASIEVELSWQQKADFALQFGSGAADLGKALNRAAAVFGGTQSAPVASGDKAPTAFEVAVWGESVVLVREQDEDADLAPLKKLKPGAGRLSLRLHFDQETGVVAAYTLEGKFLASVKAAGQAGPLNFGVRLVNKRGDVRLERLLIRRWGGAAPPEVAAGRAYIQLRNGDVVFADKAIYDPATQEFVVPAETQERRIAVADVAGMMMPRVEDLPEFALRVSMHDGVRLNGALEKVDDGRMFIARPGVDRALEAPLEEIQSLVSLHPDSAPAIKGGRTGRLETAGTSSHGTLVDADATAEASCIAWRPHGSETSSPLRRSASGRIVYRTPPPVVRRAPVRAARPQQQRGVWGALVQAFRDAPPPAPVGNPASFDQLLWLRAGDRIPCRVASIDERGVTFTTPLLEATFVPHDSIKAWDSRAGSQPRPLEDDKLSRLLTLPRMQRENPPTHLIESTTGDFLRGRLESMDDQALLLQVRLETKRIPRSNVVRIIWFAEDRKVGDNDGEDEDADGVVQGQPPSDADQTPGLEVQAVCRDGVRLTFVPERFAEGVLKGASALLGPCAVPVADVDQLYLGAAIAGAAEELAYSSWRLRAATDPRFITEDGQPPAEGGLAGLESSLVGKPAPDFTLELADGGNFRLGEQRGRVVVLDFWATWCGWCMQSMPALDALAQDFGDQVVWVAVNLQEDRKTIAGALERLGVNPRVVLDIDGAAAEKFGVTAIPQTVVVDAEGNVARVFIGGGPNLADQLRAAIEETLDGANDPAGENLND